MPFEYGDEFLGTWEPFVYDKEKDCQVWLRIRPLTEDHNEKVQKKYGKFKMNKRQGVRQRVVKPKDNRAVGFENVIFMWTGIRNGYVKLTNAATVAFFSKCLGKEFKVDEEILLPEELWHKYDLSPKEPRPLDELKTMMIQQDVRITAKVVDVGMGTDDEAAEEEEKEEEAKQEAELTKN